MRCTEKIGGGVKKVSICSDIDKAKSGEFFFCMPELEHVLVIYN